MKQQGDDYFIKLLNKIAVGERDEDVDKSLMSRSIEEGNSQYLDHAALIFAKNLSVDHYNDHLLKKLETPFAIDEVCIA